MTVVPEEASPALDRWTTNQAKPRRRCKSCGRMCLESFFRTAVSKKSSEGYCRHTRIATVCKRCEQNQRDERKKTDEGRIQQKAKDTARRHARKFDLDLKQLENDFGWQIDRIVHDMKHAWGNGCPYCRRAFRSMPKGLAELTVDIYDRSKAPHWTNTRICCATCNAEKGDMDPEAWAEHLSEWDAAERWRPEPKTRQGDLFATLLTAPKWVNGKKEARCVK